MTRRRARADREAGLVATPILVVLGFGLLASIAVIDVGAYLVAAGRAQAAADAAALAAIGEEADPGTLELPPQRLAFWTARRNDARMEACACTPGRGRVDVTVSVEVPGVFIPRVTGMQRIQAEASAELVEPPPPRPAALPPGPASLPPG